VDLILDIALHKWKTLFSWTDGCNKRPRASSEKQLPELITSYSPNTPQHFMFIALGVMFCLTDWHHVVL